jgi:hypothetical protein
MTISFAFIPTGDTSPKIPGTRRTSKVTVTLDSSYPTGGYSLTAATFGYSTILSVFVANTSTGKPCFWTGSKLKVFSAIGTEVSNATDLSAETVILELGGL